MPEIPSISDIIVQKIGERYERSGGILKTKTMKPLKRLTLIVGFAPAIFVSMIAWIITGKDIETMIQNFITFCTK